MVGGCFECISSSNSVYSVYSSIEVSLGRAWCSKVQVWCDCIILGLWHSNLWRLCKFWFRNDSAGYIFIGILTVIPRRKVRSTEWSIELTEWQLAVIVQVSLSHDGFNFTVAVFETKISEKCNELTFVQSSTVINVVSFEYIFNMVDLQFRIIDWRIMPGNCLHWQIILQCTQLFSWWCHGWILVGKIEIEPSGGHISLQIKRV